MSRGLQGALFGLAAAALFGVSAPLAKLLLGEVSPALLAGLLYTGAALGLWTHRALAPRSAEAGLRAADAPRLVAIVVSGGVLGPLAMLFGLLQVTALSGSLLLSLEGPFTMLLAVLLFKEHLGRYGLFASALIFAGAALLRLAPGGLGGTSVGMGLLALACLAWAVDNNLTAQLAIKDPFAIVRVKTLGAGLFNVALGLVLGGGAWPQWPHLAGALLLGCLSYGVSVVLDAYALRLVGAAREAAYFATAPFFGALLSLVLFHDQWSTFDLAAILAMAAGVALLLRERHGHPHTHDRLEHEHLHVHDAHHQHAHPGPVTEPHSHMHVHAPLTHDHPHVSDAHHSHRH